MLPPIGQGILDTGVNVMKNTPVGKFLFPTAPGVAQDIGAGIAAKQNQAANEQSYKRTNDLAQAALDKISQISDPAEKARLQSVAQSALGATTRGAQTDVSGFSPDIKQNPIARGLKTGVEVGTGADIISHPISTVKGIWNTAKALTVGLPQTLRTLGTGIDTTLNNPEGAVTAIKDFFVNESKNPDNFKLVSDPNSPLKKLGNLVLSTEYKGANRIVKNPSDIIGQLADYGADSPSKIATGADLITGENGIASSRVKSSIAGASLVDTDGIAGTGNTVANDLLQKATAVPQATKNSALTFVRNEMNNSVGDPMAVHKSIQNIGSQADDYWTAYHKNGSVADKQMGQFFSGVQHELLDRLSNGTTGAGGIVHYGASHIPMAPLTPEESVALKALSPKLESDMAAAIARHDLQEMKHLQQLWVQGSQIVAEAATAPIHGPTVGQNLLIAMHHPELAIAQTSLGRQTIGTGLRTLGSLNAGEAQLGADVITKAASGELKSSPPVSQTQNQGNNSQNINQGFTPSGTSSISQGPISIDSLPRSVADIKPDANGNIPPPIMPENILGPDGNPIVVGEPQGRAMEKQLADAVTKAETFNKVQGGTTEALNALGFAQNALTQFQQQRKASPDLAALGEKANATYNATNDLIGQLGSTVNLNLLQAIPTIDKLYSMTDPAYGGLKTAVQQIALYHPNDIKSIWDTHNPAVMIQQLKELQRYDQDMYLQNVRSNLAIGNQGVSQVPMAQPPTVQQSYQEANTPINNLPAIPQGSGAKYGSNVPMPGGGGAGLPPLPGREYLPALSIPRYQYR